MTKQPLAYVQPECEAMHRQGYCICTTVECFDCGKPHPPHKLSCLPARDVIKQGPAKEPDRG